MTVRLNGNKTYYYNFTLHSMWVKEKTDVDITHHLQHNHAHTWWLPTFWALHFSICHLVLKRPHWNNPTRNSILPAQVSGSHSSLSVGWWCCQLAGRWMTTVPVNGHASWSASAIISISCSYQPCRSVASVKWWCFYMRNILSKRERDTNKDCGTTCWNCCVFCALSWKL